MRWDDAFKGGHECYLWYDLLAGEGTQTDELLGYVGENLDNGLFFAQINDKHQPTQKFNNCSPASHRAGGNYELERQTDRPQS